MRHEMLRRHPEGRANRVIGVSRAALYGTTAVVLAAAMITPAVADEVDELRTEMQQLLDRMEQLETNQADTDAAVRQTNVRIDQGAAPLLDVPNSKRQRATVITPATGLRDMYVVPQTAQDNGVVGGDFPGSFKLPGTDSSMAIYGFIKADYIWNFGDTRAFPGLLDPGLIVTDGLPGSGLDNQVNFRVNPTQINIETRTPSEYGEISTLIQYDFFFSDNEAVAGPNGSTVNEITAGLRLAQASIGPLTVGQHWWAFTDLSQYAETLDYENLNSAPLGRLPGITWAESVGGGWSYAIGAYDPVTQIAEPTGTLSGEVAGVGGIFTSTNSLGGIPDFAGNVKYSQDWGHIFASGQVRQIRYEVDSSAHNLAAALGADGGATDNWLAATGKSSDSTIGWGFTVGLNLFDPLGLHPRDRFYTNFTYGEGMRGIIDASLFCFTPAAGAAGRPAANQGAAGCELEATVDPFTGEIETNTNYAWMAHYQHWWTDTIRSSFIFGETHNDSDNDFDLPGTLRSTTAAWVNLIWSPAPRVNLGVELQYADVRIKANDGNVLAATVLPVGADEGDVFQFQASALFLY